MLVTTARVRSSLELGRLISRITRTAAAVALATQAVLLGLGIAWAQHGETVSAVAGGRQGGIFGATLVLAAAVFWLTAPADRVPQTPQTQTGAVRHG